MSGTVKARRWYEIRAAEDEGGEAEVLIYDEIGRNWWTGEGVAAKQFIEDLNEIEAETLNVRINSPGGDIFEGLAIYNALARRDGSVVVHVDGLAASAASIIAMAGSEIRMAENAFMMVHNGWGIVIGNKADMREMADTLEKIDGSLAGTYARRTGQPLAKITDWLDAETWFDAEEAAEFGFADTVVEGREGGEEAQAAFNLDRFQNPPEKLVARMKAAKDEDDPIAAHIEDFRAIARQEIAAMVNQTDGAVVADPAPDNTEARRVFAESQRLLAETA